MSSIDSVFEELFVVSSCAPLYFSHHTLGDEGAEKLANELKNKTTPTELGIGYLYESPTSLGFQSFSYNEGVKNLVDAMRTFFRPVGRDENERNAGLNLADVLGLPPKARKWKNAKNLAHFYNARASCQLISSRPIQLPNSRRNRGWG